MDRRTFLKNSTLALVGSVFLHRFTLARAAKPGRVGLQLYTLRNLAQKDMKGVLEQVAAIGYNEIEMHAYFGHEPATIRGWLDELNLTTPSIHVGLAQLQNDLEATLKAAQTMGHQYIVCPWLPADQRSLADYKKHAAFFNEVGATCKSAGLKFAYHNHDFEFEVTDEKVPYDILLDATDADLVEQELDLFWITKAGRDPLEYFERYPGRFTLCHVKDMAEDGGMVSVGAGTIDFKTIFSKAEQAGLKHYFVEHDRPKDPIKSVTDSFKHLNILLTEVYR